MITVTDHKGNMEPLNMVQGVEKVEELGGDLTLSFTSFPHDNNPGHYLLEEESLVSVGGYDFRIKQFKQNGFRKEVVAISTFFDLVGIIKKDQYGGTRTFQEFSSYLFSETGWTVLNDDVTGSRFIPNYGLDNVVSMNQLLADVYGCEFQILPNKTIRYAMKLGEDKEFQYRYNYNIRTLERSVDTTNLRTRIRGYGAEGIDITYISENEGKFELYEAEAIHDEEYVTEDEMLERLIYELNDEPEITIDLDVIELTEKGIGDIIYLVYEPLDLELETRVRAKASEWVVDKFVPKVVTIGNAVKKTLSDIIATVDIKIDKNDRHFRSRIEQTNKKITLAVEEFAGDLMKAYGKIEVTAIEIRSEVGEIQKELEDGIADNTSAIVQTATDITSTVDKVIKRVDGDIESANSAITQTATSITQAVDTKVERLDGRIESANSAITQTATNITQAVDTKVERLDGRIDATDASISTFEGQLRLKATTTTVTNLGSRVGTVETRYDSMNNAIINKVSYTDYNGKTITSKINQDAESFSIYASKINLVGAVTVLSDLSKTGELGRITSGTIDIAQDIHVGNNIYLGNKKSSSGERMVRFTDGANISSDSRWNDMTISASELSLGVGTFLVGFPSTYTYFNGRVDFGRANSITGLNANGLQAYNDNSKLELALNASGDRLYVRKNGVVKGWTLLSPN